MNEEANSEHQVSTIPGRILAIHYARIRGVQPLPW